MRVGIVIADSNGGYPVPASKGGAVSTLVEHIVKKNNEKQLIDMDIISIYDKQAQKLSLQYPNINFIWMKPPKFFRLLDGFIFNFIKVVFKKKKAISYRTLFSLIYCIFSASMIIRKSKYDKIVIENNIPLIWTIRLSKTKSEFYYHLHNVPRISAKSKKWFGKCNGFICVSDFVGKEISNSTSPIGPLDTKKIHTLYNCIDTDLFVEKSQYRSKVRREYGLADADKVLIFVGRLSAEKGIDKLLESIQFIRNANVKVLIVGSVLYNTKIADEYQNKLYKLAENLKGSIIFTGYIGQEELPKLYSAADIAVLPSMWDEPAGLTMLEAMACGIPVITVESGGIPEYMGDSAILLKRDNIKISQDIAKAIDNLLSNENEYQMYKRKGIQRVHENFASRAYLERFMESLNI